VLSVVVSTLTSARDREESVRVAYAAALATLATTSARFLQRAMAPAGGGGGGGLSHAHNRPLSTFVSLISSCFNIFTTYRH
jgi:hypothetical protein